MAEIETFTAARASGNTGAACTVSGPYRSNRNAKIVVFLLAGAKFPVDSDNASTTWTLVDDAPTRTEL